MRKLLCIGVAILVAACAQVGNKEIKSGDTVSRIHAGETKKAEVRSLVGEPTKITFTDTGEEVWDYSFESYTANPGQFIPFFGALVPGEVDEHSLTVRFRPDGVVKDVGKGHRSGKVGGISGS